VPLFCVTIRDRFLGTFYSVLIIMCSLQPLTFTMTDNALLCVHRGNSRIGSAIKVILPLSFLNKENSTMLDD
jgi:hypothetical protein